MDSAVYGASPRLGNGPFRLGSPRNLSSPTASFRLVLLAARDANGEARVALLPPGPRATPKVYASVAAAVAAIRRMEASQRAPAAAP